VLLLKLPQFGVDVEGSPKVGLPLFVAILRKVSVEKSVKYYRKNNFLEKVWPGNLAFLFMF